MGIFFFPINKHIGDRESKDFFKLAKLCQVYESDFLAVTTDYRLNIFSILAENRLVPKYFWNAYDELQGINNQEYQGIDPFDYNDFEWPLDCRFIPTPFKTMVFKGDSLFGEIYYSEYGNLYKIILFYGSDSKHILIDERGFVSSIENYYHNRLVRRAFLNVDGEEIFYQLIEKDDTTIHIHTSLLQGYESTYHSMEAFLLKVTYNYLKRKARNEDTVYIANSDFNQLNQFHKGEKEKCNVIFMVSDLRKETDAYSSEESMQIKGVVTSPCNESSIAQHTINVPYVQLCPYNLENTRENLKQVEGFLVGIHISDKNILNLEEITDCIQKIQTIFISSTFRILCTNYYKETIKNYLEQRGISFDFINDRSENTLFPEFEKWRCFFDFSSTNQEEYHSYCVRSMIPLISYNESFFVVNGANGYYNKSNNYIKSVEFLNEYFTSTEKQNELIMTNLNIMGKWSDQTMFEILKEKKLI